MKDATSQRVLMICDTADPHTAPIRDNVEKACWYSRIELATCDLADRSQWTDLGGFSAIVCCAETLHRLDRQQLADIRRFVFLGGGLCFVYRGWNHSLADMIGVATEDAWPSFVSGEPEGLSFRTDLFPGFRSLDLTHEDMSGHTSYHLIPGSGTEVHVAAGNGRPLAWTNRFGRGCVLFWNTVVLGERRARGLIVQSVSAVQPVAVQAVANAAMIHIDDYPPDMYEQFLEPVTSQYNGMSNLRFYEDVWFQDMVSLAHKYSIRYTWLTVFNYSESVPLPDSETPSSDRQQSTSERTPFNADAARSAGREGELGLHGYNHFPLQEKHWRTRENMARSLTRSNEEWRANELDSLPVTYVPPNNEYDQTGALALSEACPQIETICGLYHGGDYETGGDREFGPEPWNPDLYCLPRATSGNELTPVTQFALASQVATMGVWTHFLHPDDIFETPDNNPYGQAPRNPHFRPWRTDPESGKTGLFNQFEACIEFVTSTYPWLTFFETRNALPVVKAHLDNDVHVAFEANGILLKSSRPTLFQVRLNQGRELNPVGLSNAEIVSVQKHSSFTLYTVRSTKTDARLECF